MIITITKEMRRVFREHLKKQWEEDKDLHQVFKSVKRVYGWEEVEGVNYFKTTKKEDLIDYGDRQLVSRGGQTFIRSGKMEWVGDDCDYYGEVLYYFQKLLKEV